MLYRETACSSFDDCDAIFPCDYLESDCQSNIKTRNDENILIIITAESNIEEDIQVIYLFFILNLYLSLLNRMGQGGDSTAIKGLSTQ